MCVIPFAFIRLEKWSGTKICVFSFVHETASMYRGERSDEVQDVIEILSLPALSEQMEEQVTP
jgi:hypothetical protein